MVAALVVGGLSWIGVLSSLNASAQALLPDWARARGLGLTPRSPFRAGRRWARWLGDGGHAFGIEWAFGAAAVGVALGVLAGARRTLLALELDLRPAGEWSEPHLVVDPAASDGPVLVTVEWCVRDERQAAFREAMQPVERTRRRTGARRWACTATARTRRGSSRPTRSRRGRSTSARPHG